MTTHELVIGEINVVSDFIEMLARRRARGEVSELYLDLHDAGETIMYLATMPPASCNRIWRCSRPAAQASCSRSRTEARSSVD